MTMHSVEVPFIQYGNARVLTTEQLMNDPCLADFVKRFSDCFRWDDILHIYYFEPK